MDGCDISRAPRFGAFQMDFLIIAVSAAILALIAADAVLGRRHAPSRIRRRGRRA